MVAEIDTAKVAPYCMTVTLEIDPRDEAEFNDLYDSDHLPNMIQIEGVQQIIRFRHAIPNDKGNLLYTAIYFLASENVPESPAWQEFAGRGRWPIVIRPKIKSRLRQGGPVLAMFRKRP